MPIQEIPQFPPSVRADTHGLYIINLLRIRNHIPSQQRLRHRIDLIIVRPVLRRIDPPRAVPVVSRWLRVCERTDGGRSLRGRLRDFPGRDSAMNSYTSRLR